MRRSRPSRAFTGLTAATIAIAVAACGSGGDGETSEQQGSSTAAEVVLAVSGDEGTLTPYTQNTGYPGSNLVALVYDKLLELDERNEPQPLLATGIEASPDNTEFTLPLRDDVTWHDGEPFSADDVEFSVEYYKKHTVADSAPQLEDVEDLTVDGSAVTFVLAAPDPEFPKRLLADMRILPEHIWSKIDDPETATVEQAIGTGPYKLTSYKKDQGYELEANDEYAMGDPKIDKLEVKIIPQQQTALAGLRTGEVSVYSGTVPEEQATGLEKQENIEIVRGPGFSSTLLAFNNERAPLDSPEVRTAIAAAIDIDKLIDTVLRGRGAPGSAGFWHPDAPGGQLIEQEHDVDVAADLLDEAGAELGSDGIRELAGEPLKFDLLVYSNNPQRIRTAELIRDMVAEVGIEIEVVSMDIDSLDAKVWPGYNVARGREYDMSMWGWSAPVMLDSTMLPSIIESDTALGRLNVTGTSDSDLDQLATQVRDATTLDDRLELLGQLQEVVAAKTPFVTLYYPEGAYAYRKDVFDGWVYQDGAGILNKMSYVELAD